MDSQDGWGRIGCRHALVYKLYLWNLPISLRNNLAFSAQADTDGKDPGSSVVPVSIGLCFPSPHSVRIPFLETAFTSKELEILLFDLDKYKPGPYGLNREW